MFQKMLKCFIPCFENTQDGAVRQSYGRLAGIVGILCNAVLFLGKLLVGTLFRSISITADAVNNLSDAASSVVTLIGFHIAGKPADKDHPFGHARVEYIAGLLVSFIIMVIGFDIGKSSVAKILHPEPVEFSPIILIVLLFSIALKLWMNFFNRFLGKKIKSTTLMATAADSLNDVIATSAVLGATLISHFSGLMLDGYMGLAVSVFVLISGYGIVKDTLDPLLGQAPAEDMVHIIAKKVLSYDGILGIHDLVVHSYGPGQYFASLHAEMDARSDMLTCHDIVDAIERDFVSDQIHLVIHMDPLVMDDDVINELHRQTIRLVEELDPSLTIHDFRVVTGVQHRNLVFDVVKPSTLKMSDEELHCALSQRFAQWDPTLHAVITIDSMYTCFPEKDL